MKLSQRLGAIDALITEPFDVIWDCCCDHGYLGLALLKRAAAKKIIFIDIIPKIMIDLESRLTDLSAQQAMSKNAHCWHVMSGDVGSISLTPFAKQVVVIAGVGGDLLLKLVQQIIANNSQRDLQNVQFILCPIHHAYKVRVGLNALGLGLLSEQLIAENNHFYEVLHVSFNSDTTVKCAGASMWDFTDPNHGIYRQQLLNHYNRMLNKDREYYQKVITDYQQLTDH
jgi:tRNA (adenine22-N1)-methyltransferase